MPFDKQKNQRKGFCFITFDSEQVVNELLKTPKQVISGKEVDVKKATPKPDNVPVGIGGARGNPRGRQQRGKRYHYEWMAMSRTFHHSAEKKLNKKSSHITGFNHQSGGWGNQGGYYGQGYGGYGAYGSNYDAYGTGAGGYDYYSGGYNSYDYPGYPANYGKYSNNQNYNSHKSNNYHQNNHH